MAPMIKQSAAIPIGYHNPASGSPAGKSFVFVNSTQVTHRYEMMVRHGYVAILTRDGVLKQLRDGESFNLGQLTRKGFRASMRCLDGLCFALPHECCIQSDCPTPSNLASKVGRVGWTAANACGDWIWRRSVQPPKKNQNICARVCRRGRACTPVCACACEIA